MADYDIYSHLRASELKKRPSKDFMKTVQKDINANMRAILIDLLVYIAEEYEFVPETLHLTVNYIDRYLSGNPIDSERRLELLGFTCLMIAAKYEEIIAPTPENLCYLSGNNYTEDDILDMEFLVLNYLKFEMTASTPISFLSQFVQEGIDEPDSALKLECLANYIAESSLLDYHMLCYAPSLIAASAVFLAKFILVPSKRPWSSTLRHYTLYDPSDLVDCVNDLHRLCCNNIKYSTLSAVRDKYSLQKYRRVANKTCPCSIPAEFFHTQMY